jgi:hypothetical protein
MKFRTLLSIMLIGMVSLTAFATTSKLEQKQKAELVKEFTFQASTVNVENKIVSVLMDVKEVNEIYVMQFKNVTEMYYHLAIVADVGWYSLKQRFTDIAYKEKVLQDFKNDLKLNKTSKQNQIRDNPFAENQSFKFKRRY